MSLNICKLVGNVKATLITVYLYRFIYKYILLISCVFGLLHFADTGMIVGITVSLSAVVIVTVIIALVLRRRYTQTLIVINSVITVNFTLFSKPISIESCVE